MKIELDHPLAGKLPLVANPIKMSATPPQQHLAPPLLGQHTHEVLAQILGLPETELTALSRGGVI